jgi:hypothetical protein
LYRFAFVVCVRLVRLAIYKALKVSRISVPLHIDCGDGVADGREIFRRQFHVCAAKILFEAVQLRGSNIACVLQN